MDEHEHWRLGDQTVDPHGDPIPTVEFGIDERSTHSLDELPVGAVGRFVRVSDSDPEMLRTSSGFRQPLPIATVRS